MFDGLCVGDTVFIVPQKRGPQSIAGLQKVIKIGRKYGYVQGYHDSVPFRLDNGESHSDDYRTRSNGYGFDVYFSEADYLAKKEAREQFARLCNRLYANTWKDIIGMSPQAVMSMHAILDAEGIDKKETP